jgi:hypothetical protein
MIFDPRFAGAQTDLIVRAGFRLGVKHPEQALERQPGGDLAAAVGEEAFRREG